MSKVLIVYSSDISSAAVGGIKNYISQFIHYKTGSEIDLLTICQRDEKNSMAADHTFALRARFRPHILSFHWEVIKAKITGHLHLKQYDSVIFNRHEDIILLPFIRAKHKILLIHGSICYGFKFWPLPVAFFNFLLEKVLLLFMDNIYVLLKNKQYGTEYYKKSNPWCAGKINYAPVPIASEFITNESAYTKFSDKKLRLVYFGRIVQNPKNVLLFPEFIQSFVCKGFDAELSIIGDGPDINKLQQQIDVMGLSDRFHFYGAVTIEELSSLIPNFDLTLILSDFEGICMSALESLASGVPVAAYPVGDIPEYIKDMENGVILDKNADLDVNIDKIINFISTYAYQPRFNMFIEQYYPENCFSQIIL